MAVTLNFNLCECCDCTRLTFTESTGAYSASSLPTGWGSPNAATSDATNATLLIQTPSNSTGVTLTLYPTFPTSSLTTEYVIKNTDLGLSSDEALEDGEYIFTYTVTTASTTYTQVKKALLYCNINCCVNRMLLNIEACDECGEETKDNALTAFIFLQSLKAAADCGNSDKFNSQLTILQKLCGDQDCSTCQ